MGNSFDGLPSAPLPVYNNVSSLRWPRATVPSMMGRAERPSAKKSLGRRGMYFGWSCMSWRQADSRTSDSRRIVGRAILPASAFLGGSSCRCGSPRARQRRLKAGCSQDWLPHSKWHLASACQLLAFLVRNFRYLPGLQRLQELARFVAIEERIGGFDAQEETVAAGQRESRHVEDRVIGHRQAAEAKQAENGG